MSRGATAIRLPVGQVVVIGMGIVAVSNPDKLLSLLQKSAQFLLLPASAASAYDSNGNGLQHRHSSAMQPIVIHHQSGGGGGGPPASGTTRTIGFIVQLAVGAGVCWGSYVVMTSILPDTVTGMLPVSTGIFNQAVSSLGRAVLHLKDTVMERISNLSRKQDELGDKQDRTMEEVVLVRTSVGDLKGDLRLVKESLDLCHDSLSASERRTAHIARGVQLLARGVSTFLPENDPLLRDLNNFNEICENEQQYKNPAQLHNLQQLLQLMQQRTGGAAGSTTGCGVDGSATASFLSGGVGSSATAAAAYLPRATLISTPRSSSPENELPASPPVPDDGFGDLRRLVDDTDTRGFLAQTKVDPIRT